MLLQPNKLEMANKVLNRTDLVLVDKKKSKGRLADNGDKDWTSVFKWCTNTIQLNIDANDIGS